MPLVQIPESKNISDTANRIMELMPDYIESYDESSRPQVGDFVELFQESVGLHGEYVENYQQGVITLDDFGLPGVLSENEMFYPIQQVFEFASVSKIKSTKKLVKTLEEINSGLQIIF